MLHEFSIATLQIISETQWLKTHYCMACLCFSISGTSVGKTWSLGETGTPIIWFGRLLHSYVFFTGCGCWLLAGPSCAYHSEHLHETSPCGLSIWPSLVFLTAWSLGPKSEHLQREPSRCCIAFYDPKLQIHTTSLLTPSQILPLEGRYVSQVVRRLHWMGDIADIIGKPPGREKYSKNVDFLKWIFCGNL